MNKEQLKKLSREEKVKLWNKLEDEIQRIWKNSTGEYLLLEEFIDEKIDEMILDNYGQLRFEKTIIYLKRFFYFIVGSFVLLGIIGLLFFGVKQLFGI